MTIFERQTRGILSLSVILAMIPFFVFYLSPVLSKQDPVFSRNDGNTVTIEVAGEHPDAGIYFVNRYTTIRQFLSEMKIPLNSVPDIRLQSGTKIQLVRDQETTNVVMGQMDAAKKLAMDLPVDINLIRLDELMMIPGLGGGKLAEAIVVYREKHGRLKTMDQLMNIKGIKEKKLAKLKKYLYVEKEPAAEL